MWKRNKYFFFIVFSIIAIWLIEFSKPKPINWLESYSKYDKIPYGNYILYHELSSIFSKRILTSSNTIKKTVTENGSITNYLFIDKSFYPQKEELDSLLSYVYKGNNVCVISAMFDSELLDTLGLTVEQSFNIELNKPLVFSLESTKKQYKYNLSGSILVSSFNTDSVITYTKLGSLSDSLINFIKVPLGTGQFYLHLNPVLFTNYHMLKNDNHAYVSDVLSHLPNDNLLWDEYYKNRKNAIVKSQLHIIMNTPGLRQAAYLGIISLLVYMLFASKRKQRIIPLLDIHSNDTLDFTRTIGQLYYNVKNNKDIGMKQTDFFLANIRKRFQIYTTELNDDFSIQLQLSSGVSLKEIKELVAILNLIRNSTYITDNQIIEQDKLIESFYKKTNNHG